MRAEEQVFKHFRKRNLVTGQVLLLHSSPPPSAERLVSVGGGLTMEVIPVISASIVAADVINVHLWISSCLSVSLRLPALFSPSKQIFLTFNAASHLKSRWC